MGKPVFVWEEKARNDPSADGKISKYVQKLAAHKSWLFRAEMSVAVLEGEGLTNSKENYIIVNW